MESSLHAQASQSQEITNIRPPWRVLVDLDRLREPTSGLGHAALLFGEGFARRAATMKDMRFTFLVPKKDVGRFGDAVEYVSESRLLRLFPFLHQRYDLWYCLHQDVSYSPAHGAQFVLTINDLNFLKEKSPARCAARLRRIQKFINRASAITVISDHTAQEVKENLQVGDRPFKVLPFGLELKTFNPMPPAPSFVPKRPFFLTVGVHKHTKNYRALIPFMEHMPDFDLVMLGNVQTPAGRELSDLLAKSSAQINVHLLGIVSEEDKYWFYKHCQAVLFPSISEGMGYPPLEAMQAKRPVFVFRESAVPETCGPHALYWSSQNPQQMAQEARQGLAFFESHPEFVSSAYDHGMSFSWTPVVDNYIELFRQCLK